MYRIECPNCGTSYTSERCGLITPAQDQTIDVVIECILCKGVIRAFVEWKQGRRSWRTLFLRRETALSVSAKGD